jgi:hypothetical protein
MAQFMDVTVGQKRRQALVQRLMQQRKQRQAQSRSWQFPLRARPVAGEARTALGTARSGRPRFTNASHVLNKLIPGLGPGGHGKGTPFDMSPGQGNEVPWAPGNNSWEQYPGEGVPEDTPPELNALPSRGVAEAATQASTQYGEQMGPTPTTPSPQTRVPASLAPPTEADPSLQPIGGNPAQPNPWETGPSGYVPLGGGVYFDPATGTFYGTGSGYGMQ